VYPYFFVLLQQLLAASTLCSTGSTLATQAAEEVPAINLPGQGFWQSPEVMFAKLLPFAALEDADIASLDAPVQMVVPSLPGDSILGGEGGGAPEMFMTRSKRVARDWAAEKYDLDRELTRHLSVEEIRAMRAHLRRQDDRVEMEERNSSDSSSLDSNESPRRDDSLIASGGGRRRRLSTRRGAGGNLWMEVGTAVNQLFFDANPGRGRDQHGRPNAAALPGGDGRERSSEGAFGAMKKWAISYILDGLEVPQEDQGTDTPRSPRSGSSNSNPRTPRRQSSPSRSRGESWHFVVSPHADPVSSGERKSVSGGSDTPSRPNSARRQGSMGDDVPSLATSLRGRLDQLGGGTGGETPRRPPPGRKLWTAVRGRFRSIFPGVFLGDALDARRRAFVAPDSRSSPPDWEDADFEYPQAFVDAGGTRPGGQEPSPRPASAVVDPSKTPRRGSTPRSLPEVSLPSSPTHPEDRSALGSGPTSRSISDYPDGGQSEGQGRGSGSSDATAGEPHTSASGGPESMPLAGEAHPTLSTDPDPAPVASTSPVGEPSVTAGHQPSEPVGPSPIPDPVGDRMAGTRPLSSHGRAVSAVGPPEPGPSLDPEAAATGSTVVPPVALACPASGTSAPLPTSHGVGEPSGAGHSEDKGGSDGRGTQPRAPDSPTGEPVTTGGDQQGRPGSGLPSPRLADDDRTAARPLPSSPRPAPGNGPTDPDLDGEAVANGVTPPSSVPACAPQGLPTEPRGEGGSGAGCGGPDADFEAAALDSRAGEVFSTAGAQGSGQASAPPTPRLIGTGLTAAGPLPSSPLPAPANGSTDPDLGAEAVANGVTPPSSVPACAPLFSPEPEEPRGQGAGGAGTCGGPDPDPEAAASDSRAGEVPTTAGDHGSGSASTSMGPRPVRESLAVARPLSSQPLSDVASSPPDQPPGTEAVAPGDAVLPPATSACVGAPVEMPALGGLGELKEPGALAQAEPDPGQVGLVGVTGEDLVTASGQVNGSASVYLSPRPVGESVSTSLELLDKVGYGSCTPGKQSPLLLGLFRT
jgi:hypothetical protein